jgi:hypothetical protein
MRAALTTVFLLTALNAPAQPPAPGRLRALYRQALFEKSQATELASMLKEAGGDPLTAGYRGATLMILARHGLNPFRKYQCFRSGSRLLEGAIAREPGNAELRYLRYCIQTHAPGFLGYRHALEEDRAFLALRLNREPDPELRRLIASVLTPDAIQPAVKTETKRQ